MGLLGALCLLYCLLGGHLFYKQAQRYKFNQWPKNDLSQHTQLNTVGLVHVSHEQMGVVLSPSRCLFDSCSHSMLLQQLYIKQTLAEGSQTSSGGNG